MNSRALPALALLIAIAIFFVYVNKVWSGPIVEIKEQIKGHEEALVAARRFTDQEAKLIEQRKAMNPDDLSRVERLLPGSVDNVHLILDLNALASESGLALSNIDVTAQANPSSQGGGLAAAVSPVGSVDLSLAAIGTYDALQAFLMGVERSARLLDVQDISIQGSDTGAYSYQMKIRIYWLH